MITVQVDSAKLMARLTAMPNTLRASLLIRMTTLALNLESKVKGDKLSGQVLNVRTGNLRRSINHDIQSDATSVTARVFSDNSVKYGAIHEFGGPINRVGKRKGPYTITMPQRAFMLPTFEEMVPEIKEGMNEAVKEGLLA